MKTLELILCALTFAIFIGAILLGLFKPTAWARCQQCKIFHNAKTGRQSWELPSGFDGVIEHRFCPDCSKPFLNLNVRGVENADTQDRSKTGFVLSAAQSTVKRTASKSSDLPHVHSTLGRATNEDHLPERLRRRPNFESMKSKLGQKIFGLALIAIGVICLGYIALMMLLAKGMLALIYGVVPLVAGWLIFSAASATKESTANGGEASWMDEFKAGCARIRSFLKSLL